MRPRGPNEKMKEIEVVNGGEMSGSKVAASMRRTHLGRKCPRTTVNANRKPSTVPTRPTRAPKSKLFRKAARVLGLPRMWKSKARVGRPSSRKAADSIISKG